jgi:leucyl aminopeptidase (aminopeptidase T)
MTAEERSEAFRTIFKRCLNLETEEDLLVVYDESFEPFLQAAEQAAYDLSVRATYVRVPLAEQRRLVNFGNIHQGGQTPLPPALEGAILRSRNILNVAGPNRSTLPFRLAVVHSRTDDSRLAHIPGVSEEILEVMLRTPVETVQETCEALAWTLGEANHATVLTEDARGHEHILSLQLAHWDNEPILSPGIMERGSWGNIPPGEVFCCPEIEFVNGSICVNGSIPGCVLDSNVEITLNFSQGRMSWCCQEPSLVADFFQQEESQAINDGDDNWNCFAELGFGLNPAITELTGNPLFDEKANQTLHIAFGDNSGFGHNVLAKTHQDLVVKKPTLVVDGRVIIKHGNLLLEQIEHMRRNFMATEAAISPTCSIALREKCCAVRKAEPRYPEARSPRIDVLTQLGILQRASPSTRICLCKGAITSLVEGVARQQASASHRIGTLVSDMGPRIFVAEELHPDDDDLVVIHLSDLHIGSEYRHLLRSKTATKNLEQRSLGELPQEDLRSLSLERRVDAIVLSGDVVSDAAKWDQFLRAREVIQEMLEKINVPIERLLVIPGNHDVDWAPNELSNVESGRPVSFENYRAFIELLGKRENQDVAFLSLVSRAGRVRLRIVGLDSNHVEGPNAGGIGYVSGSSFETAERMLAGDDAESKRYRQVCTWLTVHHHLLPVTAAPLDAARARKVSVMGNAALVQSYATRWGVELVLHGHEHQPAITVARRWPIDAGITFSPLTVLAAGSIGAKVEFLGPFARNQYFLIYRRPQDIIVRSRCMGDAGIRFVTHNDIFLPQPGLAEDHAKPGLTVGGEKPRRHRDLLSGRSS